MSQNSGSLRPTLRRVTTRAVSLIESMLLMMEDGLRDPQKMEEPAWKRLFGDKESAALQLQKLVHALAALNVKEVKSKAGRRYREAGLMTAQDAQILSTWMTEQPVLEG